jgi:hypothetical protein
MRHARKVIAISLITVTMGFASACSSSDSPDGDATPRTTLPGTPKQLAVREADAVLAALHEENNEFCKTPSFETNIVLPKKQELPIPITRGSCIYEGARLQVVAFEDPANRAIWMQNWTKRMCKLSNEGPRTLMAATYWVVNPYTVLLAPTPATAQTVQEISGGEVQKVECPPEVA